MPMADRVMYLSCQSVPVLRINRNLAAEFFGSVKRLSPIVHSREALKDWHGLKENVSHFVSGVARAARCFA